MCDCMCMCVRVCVNVYVYAVRQLSDLVFSRTNLGSHFNEIYHMPEVPVLTNVNAVLREHSKEPRRCVKCVAIKFIVVVHKANTFACKVI